MCKLQCSLLSVQCSTFNAQCSLLSDQCSDLFKTGSKIVKKRCDNVERDTLSPNERQTESSLSPNRAQTVQPESSLTTMCYASEQFAVWKDTGPIQAQVLFRCGL
jgi:hypothetical protein